MRLLSAVASAVVLTAIGGGAQAQQFPTKPVRIIIAFPPGGAIDTVARIMAPKLSENLGQQFVVDNRGGAGGLVGTELAAKAPADGHTILFGTMGNLSVNPLLYAKLPFDIARDFAPLTQVVSTYFMLYTHPSVPVRTVKDLIALARARPGQINFASSGGGGAPHLAGELFNSMAGVKLVHIPYKGSSLSVADTVGGHVHLTFDSVSTGLPFVKSGRLRALATLAAQRVALLPDAPPVADTLPGYEVVNWFGMVVPAATPRDIVTRLHGEIVKVLRLPDIREKLLAQGTDPVGNAPEAFGVLMKAETAKWARVIKEANIKAD